MAIRVFQSPQEILNALQNTVSRSSLKILGMYDSFYNAIITTPIGIRTPIMNKINQGLGVFETANCLNGHVYQLPAHIDRLQKSSSRLQIQLPLSEQEISDRVYELIRELEIVNCRLRIIVSAGIGLEENSQSIIQILAYTDNAQEKPLITPEYIVSVPVKPRSLANVKSTNYLINALCFMESREKGGYQGVQLDDNGFLAEVATANIAVILEGGRFCTPTPRYILKGTTLRRVLLYCEDLISQGLLETIEQRNISKEEAYNAKEFLIIGGDACVGVNSLDGHQIGDGQLGEITQLIQEFLKQDMIVG